MTERVSAVPRPNTVAYYNAFGPYYDEETTAAGLPAKVEAMMDAVFEVKPPHTIESALDLGAGTGIVIDAIRKQVLPARMVAVDPSAEMLVPLRQKYSKDEVEVVTETLESYIARCGDTFDLITSNGVLELVPGAPNAVADAARLLKQSGIIAVTYVPRAEGGERELFVDDSESLIKSTMMEYRWLPEEIEDAMGDSGLTVVGRINDIRIQEHSSETNTDERNYNFVVGQKG